MALTATFGTPTERGLEVVLPFVVSADATPAVRSINYSSVRITKDENSIENLDFDFVLINTAVNNFACVFRFDAETRNKFTVEIDGHAYNNGTSEAITSSASALLDVDTRSPILIYPDDDLAFRRRGDIIDVIQTFNRTTKFVNPTEVYGPDATYADFFYVSRNLSSFPALFINVAESVLTKEIPEILPGGDWETFTQASDPSSLFLLRYSEVPDSLSGALDVRVKRGSVSSDILIPQAVR